MKSVIVKPIGQFIARPTQRYPGKSPGPTLRQAAALVASAAANGLSMDAAVAFLAKCVLMPSPG
jgi:hypothetical protein